MYAGPLEPLFGPVQTAVELGAEVNGMSPDGCRRSHWRAEPKRRSADCSPIRDSPTEARNGRLTRSLKRPGDPVPLVATGLRYSGLRVVGGSPYHRRSSSG